ncbi:hypothetical protein E2C01_035193 [Portunus trituberculatus]|uniref:Uncharacterized protein n=1 Tax=Portunus trituberculatus TaxID=210409 RepID=A0A5B7FAT2_PORTR|nr:hypothetical protein [Portunus trituberculatus]
MLWETYNGSTTWVHQSEVLVQVDIGQHLQNDVKFFCTKVLKVLRVTNIVPFIASLEEWTHTSWSWTDGAGISASTFIFFTPPNSRTTTALITAAMELLNICK